MIYSDWDNSHWLCFWNDPKHGIAENKDNAIFGICGCYAFTAKQLRDNMKWCMDQVDDFDREGDVNELQGYAEQFLKDVNEKYK